eukprot:gene4385-4430_t
MVAALHVNLCLAVHRLAIVAQPAEYFARVALAQQRAVILAADTFDQGIDIAVDPHRNRAIEYQPACIGIDKGAAAGGQNFARGAIADQPRNHPAFARTEIGLAKLGENFRNGHLRGAFDFLVRIDKGQRQLARQLSPDRGLAHAHHSHQHDRTIKPCGNPLHIGVREWFVLHCRVAYTCARAKCKLCPLVPVIPDGRAGHGRRCVVNEKATGEGLARIGRRCGDRSDDGNRVCGLDQGRRAAGPHGGDTGAASTRKGSALMRRRSHLALAALGLALGAGLTGVLAAQESLLPPGFDDHPAPRPRPATAPRPAAERPAPTRPAATVPAAQRPVVQPPRAIATTAPVRPIAPVAPIATLPEDTAVTAGAPAEAAADPIDAIDPAIIDQVVQSAAPRFDIPPQARRSLDRVGFLAAADGGLPSVSTHYLSGDYVAGLLTRMQGPLVSRWGHILLRRVLASRLDTPVGMNGADWAALRAALLLRMGEVDSARALVQEVDSGFYTRQLEDAAMATYLSAADPAGLCPIDALTAVGRPGWDWDLSRSICLAFNGSEGSPALAQLDRAMRRGSAAKIDILLAQKFAGSANTTHRAVQIEWTDVDGLTPWRAGLAFATGLEPPEALRRKDWPAYAVLATRAPTLSLASRAAAADVVAASGVLSSAAMVDLYAQIAALQDADGTWGPLAAQLRAAYVDGSADARLAAIKALWGDGSDAVRQVSRQVLTAYAAARIEPAAAYDADAAALIASMLSAGLDRNAVRWASVVAVGSQAWGTISLAAPTKLAAVNADALAAFKSGDTSPGTLRSGLLLAGLMGLGRVDAQTARDFAGKLNLAIDRHSAWTGAIDAAAASHNPALVAMLAAYGMQGSDWNRMTPLHLYHIVGALRQVGLEAEARMIAAEAVART